MKEFYNLRKMCGYWEEDMKWLRSTNWSSIEATPDLFGDETDSHDLTPDTAGAKHKSLAAECAKVLDESCFDSRFRLTSGDGLVKVENIVGMLARDRMLSDIILDFSIRCICSWLGDCYAMDSFAPTVGCPSPPDVRIANFHFVVLPVHLSDIHWGITMVKLAYHQEYPCFTPYYYEPLCGTEFRATMEDIYEETVATFLQEWHCKTMSDTDLPGKKIDDWLDVPNNPTELHAAYCVLHRHTTYYRKASVLEVPEFRKTLSPSCACV